MNNEGPRRLAANEALLRQVNESINRGRWPGEDADAISFRCECSELGCNSLVPMTAEAYEDVRSNPRWFVMRPGHELHSIESVVASGHGYVVVEKQNQAGRVAESTDPRP